MLWENVLTVLEENKGNTITGGQIARQLGVSRNSVWKAIHSLQEKGHQIISKPNSGYQLCNTSDGLSSQTISQLLTTQKIGQQMEIHESLTSTNTYLKNLDITHFPEGFTVIADGQQSGRGRLGRTFHSPAHEGIYLSVLLKPDIALQSVTMLTICTALAVCNAIEKVCKINPQIKWVNDIFVNGKKLCGILTEATVSAELQKIESVIVGIGVNTGFVDKAVKSIASSIFEQTGQRSVRNELIAEILNQLEIVYNDVICNNKKSEILAKYSDKLLYIEQQVEVKEAGKTYKATVLGVEENGALTVVLPDGKIQSIYSGEIFYKEGKL